MEIYTDREGEVIFKKYSPIGEMTVFAAQYADTLYKTCQMAVVICDRDAVIACSGISKKEYTDRKLSASFERIIEDRTLYTSLGRGEIPIVEGGNVFVSCAMPIISDGDITGCVASVITSDSTVKSLSPEIEAKLIQTAAGFLGRQLES